MDYYLWFVQIATVLCLIYYYVNRKFSYWTDRGVQGPTPLPFLGNFWELMIKGQIVTEMEWSKKYGKVYGQYSNFEPVLKIADNELIKQVMVRDFNLFVNRGSRETNHEIWSRNLFGLENDDWKRIRSITSPSFTSGKLKGMNPLMHRCTDKLMDYFDKLSCNKEERSFNTKDVIAGFTIDVIASTSFATDTNSNDDRAKANSFVDHGMKLFLFSKFRIFVLIFWPMWLRNLTGYTLGFEPEHFNFFRDLVQQVIKQRKETNIVKQNDFVQLLMDSRVAEGDLNKLTFEELTATADKEGNVKENVQKVVNHKVVKALTDNEIIAQCILFFIAGYETTASTITHCLFELATNPETQNRLADKLGQKLEGLDDSSEEYYETVMTKIPYLDSVIKETLRKYPPLPVLERRVSVSGYKLGGIELKKDQLVEIAAYAVHHNAEYYPEPERFNPERFMPENKHCLKPYTYLPFGQGPRNCIGMRFAYQEIKLCLAKIIPKFQFCPTVETPRELQFVKIGLLTVKPFPLKVNKRE